jgi:hypothetical protein
MNDGIYSIVAFYSEDNEKCLESKVRFTRTAEPKPFVVVDLVQGSAPPADVIDARQPIKHTIRQPFTEDQLKALKVGAKLWFSASDFAYRNKD